MRETLSSPFARVPSLPPLLRKLALAMLVLVAAIPLAALVRAADGDQPIESDVSAGVQYFLDKDPASSAKFEEYRDVPNGFVAERLRFAWRPASGSFLTFTGFDLAQKDERLSLSVGKQDVWQAFGSWKENPRQWTDHAQQLWTTHGNAIFTLDDTLQSAIQAAPASVDANADGRWDPGTKGALLKSAILASADDVHVGHQRQTGSLGFTVTPVRALTVRVNAERERRDGTAPQSLGMYFTLSPGEVAAPLDYKTDTASVNVEWARPRWLVGAELSASDFETRFDSLEWDNQLALNDTAAGAGALPARGRLNLATDSQMNKAVAYGGVDLPGRTRINATLSRSKTEQDDAFLPKTTNTLLSPAPLPARSLDGSYTNTLVDLRVHSMPLRWMNVSGWWRDYDWNNDTPSLRFKDYVMTDYSINTCSLARVCDANGDGTAGNDRIQRRNLPLSFDRKNLGALLKFMPLKGIDLSAGYEKERWDREFSAVVDSSESITKLAADVDLSDWVSAHATFRSQRRRADEYHAHYFEESFPIGEPFEAGFNEGARRFFVTDRDRKNASLMLDVTPAAGLSLYAEATHTKDDYLDPETGRDVGDSFQVREDRDGNGVPENYTLLISGRTHDKLTSYTLGASYDIAKQLHVFADYTWETWKYGLASRYRCPGTGAAGSCPTGASFVGVGSDNPLDNWGSDAKDDYRTAYFGFDLAFDKNRTWTLAGSYSYSKGTGDLETHFTPGGTPSGDTTLAAFPRLSSKLQIASLGATHTLGRNLDYTIRYWFEKWDDSNWSSDFMRPYMGDPGNDPGSQGAAYLGMDFDNYENHIVSVLLHYRFP